MIARRTASITGLIAMVTAGVVSAEMGAISTSPVKLNWPGIATVWQHRTMYMTSDPNEEGLRYAKSQGVQTIIDLMEHSEHRKPHWTQELLGRFFPTLRPKDEATFAREIGLRYEHIPVSVQHPSEEAVRRFLATVQAVNAQRLLIHCDIGGRALAMYAIYLGTCEGYTPQQALAQAKAAGLNHEGLEQFVLAYLTRYATHTT